MNFAGVIQGVVALLWLVVVGLIVMAVMRASRGQSVKGLSTGIIVAILLAAVLTTVSAGLVFIQPNERGVVISAIAPKGYREQALTPGLRWIIPYVESVERYKISMQNYTMSIAPLEGQVQGDDSVAGRTSDGQEVLLDASVIFSIDPTKVVTLHINWQKRYVLELVRPVARGVMRDAVAQFAIAEVYSTRRAEMTQEIEDVLGLRLAENGLILADFVLRNVQFSAEYAASVEQKQIAEQQAQQAKFVVEQRKQEADQARETARGRADSQVIEAKGAADARVIQAAAEKEALQLIAEALVIYPDLLTYQYINNLTPNIRVMLVPSEAPFLLPLPSLDNQSFMEPNFAPTLVPNPLPTPLPTPVPTPSE